MQWGFLPTWPLVWPSTVALGGLALASLALGEAAARWLRVPRILGYLAAGAAFGVGGRVLADLRLEALPHRSLEFALDGASAYVLFDLGQRVSFGWLRRNPMLLLTSAAEAGATFVAVVVVLRMTGSTALGASLVGAIAMASSPAIALAVTRELRAQGQVTERLLLLTAMNCAYAVVLSTLLLGWAQVESRGALDLYVLHPLYLMAGSLAIAAVGARLTLFALAAVGRDRAAQIMTMLALVAIVFGVARTLRLSEPLTLLACGAFVRLDDRNRRLAGAEFGTISAFVIVMFFALSSATIDVASWPADWGAALGVIVVRQACKCASTTSLARLGGIRPMQGLLLGIALAPQSTLALQLARQVEMVDPRIARIATSVIVGEVIVLQVFGTLALAWALRRGGEARAER